MTMSEYLDANQSDMARTGNDKEMYTITYNQNFAAAGVSIHQLPHQNLLIARNRQTIT